MTLHIYDTGTRTTREFVPARADQASIYVCGPTPQGAPHIGHVRGALNYDVLRRWLARDGGDVLLVRNVTDVDDKILAKAAEHKTPWWAWAALHERAFEDAYATLGCLPPSIAPRATGHITQMVELMRRLIDAGAAYAAGGDVYFAVEAYPGYGSLSGQRLDEMQQGESAASAKKDPRDFTLWKAGKPGEPSWPTPWGPGRPGWHLECSAMAVAYLGETFDIHGGGVDLIFPHHENELAQSRAAGDEFARYWMHNAWVTLSGEKMSKSLGNVVAIPEMLKLARAVELRYYLISAHYRSTIEYSPDALADAVTGYRRIESFLGRVQARTGALAAGELSAEFIAAMDDDLSTPRAIGAVHSLVREGNAALESGAEGQAREKAGAVLAMTELLGIQPSETPESNSAHNALAALVDALLEQRVQARKERDFATADQVRTRLLAAGISVEDTPGGPQWTLKDD